MIPPATLADASLPTGGPVPPPPDETHEHAPVADHPPPTVPGYEVLSELGRGGMGVVYLARQRSLARVVALKLVRGGESPGRRAVIRFLAEAEAVAAITHPHVVCIHEYGEHDGRPYMALEYLSGGTLADKLRNGSALSSGEVAKLVEKVARGVAAAHDLGIVHRDLKPSNVLFDTAGEPKVTDFGLAKRTEAQDLTRTGVVFGTPAYMAPEQARGEARSVGPASDVYSLGVILYECLTGRLPFAGADSWELIRQVMTQPPPPPRRFAKAVPRDLETVCLKCLEKESRKRYRSAAELADDLNRFREGRPILARPVGVVGKLVKSARRNPLVATLASVLFTVMLVSIGLITWKWTEAESRAKGEAAAREEAEESLYLSRVSGAVSAWQLGNAVEARRLLAECPPERREWEWNLLARLTEPAPAAFALPGDQLHSFAVLPDGQFLTAASKDGLALRKPEATEPRWRQPISDKHWVIDMATVPATGEIVAVAANDMHDGYFTEMQWEAIGHDAKTGNAKWRRPFQRKGKSWIALSPKGDTVAVLEREFADSAGMLTVEDARTGAVKFTARAHPATVPCLPVFDPTGRKLATLGSDRVARLWDTATGAGVVVANNLPVGPAQLALSRDGKLLAVRASDGLHVFDTATARERYHIAAPLRAEGFIRFGPDDRLAAVWNDGAEAVRVWNGSTGQELGQYRTTVKDTLLTAFQPDGRALVVVGMNGDARLWTLGVAPGERRIRGRDGYNAFGFSPDGRFVASGGSRHDDGYAVAVHDLHTGERVAHYRGHTGGLHDFALTPDGRILASAGTDLRVNFWDRTTGQPVGRIDVPTAENPAHSSLWRIQLRDGGRKLLTVRKDGLFQQWDVATKQLDRTIYHIGETSSVDFHPDGRRALASVRGGRLIWIDLQKGEKLGEIERPGRIGGSVVFSPDGETFLMAELSMNHMDPYRAEQKYNLELRDTATGQVRQLWPGYDWGVEAVFTPRGRRIVTRTTTGVQLAVFDTRTGRPVITLPTGAGVFDRYALSPDGHWFVGGTNDDQGQDAENVLLILDARPLATK